MWRLWPVAVILAAGPLWGQTVRYVARQGTLYQEWVCRRWQPVREVVYETRRQVVYRTEETTQEQEVLTVVRTPRVQWVWEPTWQGLWNPFARPVLSYRLVPRTVWHEEVRRQKVPVKVRRLVPEVRTCRVPVVKHRWVLQEVVVSRVPLGPLRRPAAQSLQLAGGPYGGIRRLESDPPRVGSIRWRPASTTSRR